MSAERETTKGPLPPLRAQTRPAAGFDPDKTEEMDRPIAQTPPPEASEDEPDPDTLRIALNRPVSISTIQAAEARRNKIASEQTHVGPTGGSPNPSSSSD